MRVLGVDFGSRRIGIAVAEVEHHVITARPNLDPAGSLKRDAANLAALAKREEAERIVLGHPIDPGSGEGRMASVTVRLAEALKDEGCEVVLVDETLTSAESEQALFEQGHKASRRKQLLDSESARRILERYLAST